MFKGCVDDVKDSDKLEELCATENDMDNGELWGMELTGGMAEM